MDGQSLSYIINVSQFMFSEIETLNETLIHNGRNSIFSYSELTVGKYIYRFVNF